MRTPTTMKERAARNEGADRKSAQASHFAGNGSGKWRVLAFVWIVFALLVLFKIHGSSFSQLAYVFRPNGPQPGYLLDFLPPLVHGDAQDPLLREFLAGNVRDIRSDEWHIDVPMALSQLSHNPRFPVVNTNMGLGQNMLLLHNVPVWHISTLAKPITWGYFLFGAERGLAWYWWFQSFAAFSALFLLLEIILKGDLRLAAFGAFWFCISSYVVVWSLWPAYFVFFPAAALVAFWYLLKSPSPRTKIVSGIILGLSTAGFVLLVYPPWQVPLGYLFLFLFIALSMRDKLYLEFSRASILCFLLAVLVAGIVVGAWLHSALPALAALSNTVYPGHRISIGGTHRLTHVFRGVYDLMTRGQPIPALGNTCEAASFYLLFPAVFIGVCCSRPLLKRMGWVGWSLIFTLAASLYYTSHGISEGFARVSMLSYVPEARIEIMIGLASILLCVYTLHLTGAGWEDPSASYPRKPLLLPVLGALGTFLFFAREGYAMERSADGFPQIGIAMFIAIYCAAAAYAMLAGMRGTFFLLVGMAALATGAFFNPLSVGCDFVFKSELVEQISRVNKESGGDSAPLWVCYGPAGLCPSPDTEVSMTGGRVLGGVHFYPQMDLWHKLDPEKAHEEAYNCFAHVMLFYGEGTDGNKIVFFRPADTLVVQIPPTHPFLRSLGARYMLSTGASQGPVYEHFFEQLIYKSQSGDFSIYDIGVPDWKHLKKVAGGVAEFDFINGLPYKEAPDNIVVNAEAGKPIVLSGAAWDDLEKDVGARVSLVFQSGDNEIVIPATRATRGDVVAATGEAKYARAGFSAYLDNEHLEKKTWKVALRILRSNRSEYLEVPAAKTITFP